MSLESQEPNNGFKSPKVSAPVSGFTPINAAKIPQSDGSSEYAASEASSMTEPVTPTKKKSKNGNKGEVDADDDDIMTTPTPKSKQTPKGKSAGKIKADLDESATPESTPGGESVTASGRKRVAKTADGDTPSKKTRKPRAVQDKFPESQAEFSDGDRLILFMKRQSKSWPEIQEAWTNVTGVVPGKDVLRKRYAKLLAVAQDWKEGDEQKLVDAKRQVEETLAATIKKLEREKWADVAKVMLSIGADEYKPAAIEKKWDSLVKQKLVDADGNYSGSNSNGHAITVGNSEVGGVKDEQGGDDDDEDMEV